MYNENTMYTLNLTIDSGIFSYNVCTYIIIFSHFIKFLL